MKLKIIFILVFSLLMSACSLIYIPAVQQGNILTASDIKKVHTGMTSQQVVNTLGTPVLANAYANNKLIYAYSFKPGYSSLKTSQAQITFYNNKVTKISSTY